MDENKLGKKITTLREAHHLTAQDLADRCQCDLAVIEGLEAGEVPASLAPLIKICLLYTSLQQGADAVRLGLPA